MLFNSVSYLIFLPLVLVLYWLGPVKWRLSLLLLASYVFYMSWLPQYALLLGVLTVGNFAFGHLISCKSRFGKVFLVLGLVFNLGTLTYFKYANFLLQTLLQGVNLFAVLLLHKTTAIVPAPNCVHWNVILPLGISFFVFEFIHYLVEVYKGNPPIKEFEKFAVFAAFFPSQIAGPIKRYQDFCSQLATPATWNSERFQEGISLLIQGLFKKIALADNLAVLADTGFGHIAIIGTADAWLATLAFTLQIYFDFSGYTDMGRGSAMLLGFSLPDNFNIPYIARNLSDFWKRWHISLSAWLRDYLYIPLGGSKCSQAKKYCNLMITMLLGGLWHGAAWHYILWGAFHGVGLVGCHLYDNLVKRIPALHRAHAHPVGVALSVMFTFLFVVLGWVVFRAGTVAGAVGMFHAMGTWQESQIVLRVFEHSTLAVSLSIYASYALWLYGRTKLPTGMAWSHQIPVLPVRAAMCIAAFIAAIGFAPAKVQPFIYFQF